MRASIPATNPNGPATATSSRRGWPNAPSSQTSTAPQMAAAVVTRVMRRHISAGELGDALAQLPAEISGVLEQGCAR
jgi:hypothetical protein